MKTPSGIKVNLGRERGGENNADSSGQKVPHVTPEGSTHTSLGTILSAYYMSLCHYVKKRMKTRNTGPVSPL